MNYLSIKEVAEKWQLSERSIQKYCADDKIPGARNIGRQWLIPDDAVPPADGRTKISRNSPKQYLYHFPVLVYSQYYNSPDRLDETEQQLLSAQTLHFEGKYSESLILCRKILEGSPVPSIAAGAYFTIGFNSLLLGLYSLYKDSVVQLERLTHSEVLHAEDFKLITYFLKYHGDWNSSSIYQLNPDALSPDAVILYKYTLLLVSSLSGKIETDATLDYIKSDFLLLEQEHITPAACTFGCIIAMKSFHAGREADTQKYADIVAKLAVKNNWIPHMAKFYNFGADVIENCLCPYGEAYLISLKERNKLNIRNWIFIHEMETNKKINSLFTGFQSELLLLISYNFSISRIAKIKKLSESVISKEIRELCKIAEVDNKTALVAYAKAMFETRDTII